MVQEMFCHYSWKHFRAKTHAQNSNLKTSLEKQPENAISHCCSRKEKDEKSERNGMGMWKEIKKVALAPRNAIARSAIFASFFVRTALNSSLFWSYF